MKITKLLLGILAAASFASAQAGTTDTLQYGTPGLSSPTYFINPASSSSSSPYYRYGSGDWGWQHNAIAGSSFTSATLNISAYDVDESSGEIDNIYAYDNGVAVLLGNLDGNNNAWAFTTFTLGANFYDDINNGLKVFMNIDSGNGGWAVTLAKSSLAVDGGVLPPPIPTAVPEPETYAMMLAGLGLMGAVARRRKSKQA